MQNDLEMPKNDKLGSVIWLLISGAISLSFGAWIFNIAHEKFLVIQNSIALTGDGKLTILDLPNAIFSALIEIGRHCQIELAGTKFGAFMAMNAETPNLFWSVVISGFVYFVFLISVGWFFEVYIDAKMREIN